MRRLLWFWLVLVSLLQVEAQTVVRSVGTVAALRAYPIADGETNVWVLDLGLFKRVPDPSATYTDDGATILRSTADEDVAWLLTAGTGGGEGGSVTSVAGRTGVVVLTKADVGLASVDNTSDTAKPISTATQTALDGKANTSHTQAASTISDSTAAGRSMLTAADAAAQRSLLTLGGAAVLSVGTTAGTVAAGNDSRFLTTVALGDLTDAGDSTLHYHATDRARANHTGSQAASTISDFSEAADDRVAALLVAGANITLSYSDVGNALTIDAATGGLPDGDLGDIEKSGNALTIEDSAVTLAKMADLAQGKLMGRYSVGAGVPQAITVGSGLTLDTSGNLTASSSSISGGGTVNLITALATLTGTAGTIVRTAHGFYANDGGASAWAWVATGYNGTTGTNASWIYGGTSGHYWRLLPDNGTVAATTLGLVGDASANNATVFANLLAIAPSSNWTVFLPAGQYNLGSMITSANLTNLTITGPSSDKAFFYWTHSGTSVEGWRWTGTGGKIRFKGIGFKANPANDVRLFAMNGLYQDVEFRECELTSKDKIWYSWATTSAANDFRFENCWLHGTTDSGAAAITFGVSSLPSTNVVVRGCKIDNIAGSPIELYFTKGMLIENNTITNCGNLDSQQSHNIYVSGGNSDLMIRGNRLADNRYATKSSGVAYIQIYEHAPPLISCYRVWIVDNDLGGLTPNAAGMADGAYVYGTKDVVIRGNFITNIYQVGIAFGDSNLDGLVEGNMIYGAGTALRGVTVHGSDSAGRVVSRIKVIRNSFQGFLREAIGFGGTHGLYAGNFITLDTPAQAAGMYAISVISFDNSVYAFLTDNVISGNYITDKTTAPTYVWGGIRSGRQTDSVIAQYNTIQGNFLNSVRGAPIKANHSSIKVYENTRIRPIGANDLTSATVRNND